MRQLFTLFVFLWSSAIFAQSSHQLWKDVNEADILLSTRAQRQIVPQKYRTLALDLGTLKENLRLASTLHTPTTTTIDIPMPDGSNDRFLVWESSIMMPALAASYPNIKTYKIKSIANPSHIGRMGYTQLGFHATITTEQGEIYIDPFAKYEDAYYISYFTKDHIDVERKKSMKCDLSYEDELEFFAQIKEEYRAYQQQQNHQHNSRNEMEDVVLRNYRLALATTAEYSVWHGGTKESVMSAVVVAMNRVNGIVERELGVHFNLIDGTDQLFFFDAATDGYTNGNTQAMIDQNPTVINSIFSPLDYDIGHVLGTNAGGLAQRPSVCGSGKARGVTCHGNPIGDNFYVDYISHEMGHQMGGPHTFNLCDMDNEYTATAFEPGSGSTIMSYSGLCGPNNIQFDSDDYYHIGALELMTFYMQEGGGNTCAEHIPTSNTKPVAEIPFEGDFYIPIRTPFELEGAGTDAEGDEIRYCWEQYDLGPMSDVGVPSMNAPIFRSFPPTTNPIRTIPRLQDLLVNTSTYGENLPTYSRDITFRLTVRDYHTEAGGANWEEVAFKATEAAGPFRVTYPSALDVEMEVGSYVEINWNVANTDANPVNCQGVDIYLSTDGGLSFPIQLATNTPNDGSAFVLIPDEVSNSARIKIKAADNIFFDISNNNFKIVPPSTPGYSLNASPVYQQVCLPNPAIIELETASLLEYNDQIEFEVLAEGLPTGAVPSFSANPLIPSDNGILEIDMTNVTEEGVYEIVLQATAPNTETAYRTLFLEVVSNDFSELAILSPSAGQSGVTLLPEFTWNMVVDANSYEIEVATDATFENIIDSADGLTSGTYTPAVTLVESTPYYWRVFPVNECGKGMPLPTNSFHTVTSTCFEKNSADTPFNVSGSGTPTIESKLNIIESGTINDLNIPFIRGFHSWFSDLRITLISPAGTEAILFSWRCNNYNGNFNFGIDDEAPFNFSCPPTNGNYKSQQALSRFIGEEITGIWTLRVEDREGGNGGQVEAWNIEFCTSVSTTPPVLVNNEEMSVNPNEGRYLSNEFLLTEDPNNEEWELIYTLVDTPKKGTLALEGVTLNIGDEFSQSDIHWDRLRYTHSGANTLDTDAFRFTVRDDEGGWIGTPQFDILIDPNAIVSTTDISTSNMISIFPNPAKDLLQITFAETPLSEGELQLVDVKGRTLLHQQVASGTQTETLKVNRIPSGIYFVQIQFENGTPLHKKVIIE